MSAAPIPPDDEARIASLHDLNLLATPAEIELDRVTRTAAAHFDVPVALITLVDRERQWFKSRFGTDVSGTSRDVSFCAHTILQHDLLVIPDLRQDPRFADNPLVAGEPHVVFYAGRPLHNRDGYAIGTLCLIDMKPRDLSDESRRYLSDLGRWPELAIENRRMSDGEAQLLRELDAARRESLLDPMTRTWNRRGFSSLIEREIAKSLRAGTPIALAMIDIDFFKRINDTYGHPEGDTAIRLLAELLREHTRSYDVLARLGGEEFAVIMPGVQRDDAERLGEKLRAAVEQGSRLPSGHSYTISVGVTWRDPAKGSLSETALVEEADKALYLSKQNGRNRVTLAATAG